MSDKGYTDLVGVLVGAIMHNSRPIIINLYIMKDGTGHTRTSEYGTVCDPEEATRATVKAYGRAVSELWRNNFRPAWYFIQLSPYFYPKHFLKWSLPWTATDGWKEEKWRD